MRYLAALLATALAASGNCTSAAADDAAKIVDCLKEERAAYRDGRACIGKLSDPCLHGSGSKTTKRKVECFDREINVWNGVLEADYQTLLKVLPAKAAATVRRAQQDWVELRDADCQFPYDIHGRGTIARPYALDCVLRHTATRDLQVRSWYDMAHPEEVLSR